MRRPESLLLCLLLVACASGGGAAPSGRAANGPSSDGRLNLSLAEGYLAKGEITTPRSDDPFRASPRVCRRLSAHTIARSTA